MIISGEQDEVYNVIKEIKINFKISKCGSVVSILGINVRLEKHFTYSISQENFIMNILDKYNICNIKKSKTPCTGNNSISENKAPFNKTIYKSAIGSLIYYRDAHDRIYLSQLIKLQEKAKNQIYPTGK